MAGGRYAAAAALLTLAGLPWVLQPAQAAYGGTPGRVFFTSDRDGGQDIWSMNPDGSRAVRLTSTGDNLSPALSPDGTRVAFVSGRDVWTMAVDGTDRVRVTETAAVEESPVWSPDGSRLAFVTNRAPDGGTDQEIVALASSGAGTPVQLTSNTVPDVDPAWSDALPDAPEGMIAFVSARAGDTNRNVYVMSGSGGPATSVTPNGTFAGLPYQGHDDDPAWSADGRIAYTHTHDPNGGRLAIWSVEPDGSRMTRLSQDGDRSASEPAWSPTGAEVAFVLADGTDRNIAVMAVDGSNVRTVDASTSHDIAPDWQEDSVDPDTLLLHPPASGPSDTAHVAFRSTEPGSDLECSLDGAPFSPCASPLVLNGLDLGSHGVAVRAIDPVGRVDRTPATHTWTVTAPVPTPTPSPSATPTPSPTTPTPTPTPTVIPGHVTVTTVPTVVVDVPDRVRLRSSGRRVPVVVRTSHPGSLVRVVVQARLGGRWVTLGRQAWTSGTTGREKVRVKVARRWVGDLGTGTVKARVQVVVSSPEGQRASDRDAFSLRG